MDSFIFVAKFIGILKNSEAYNKISDPKSCVDEKLGTYFNCIDGLQQKRWFAKETYLRNKLNIKTLSDLSYKKLKNNSRGTNFISNTINFDILSNIEYSDKFYYSCITEREGKALSDYVDSIIYLGEDRNVNANKSNLMGLLGKSVQR